MTRNHPGAYGLLAGLWFLFLVFTMLQLACVHAASTPGAKRSVSEREAYTVSIEMICVQESGGWMARGSGVLVGPHTILTADHVARCDGMAIANIEDGHGNKAVAMVDREWPKHDVARLHSATSFGDIKRPSIGKVDTSSHGELCTSVAVPQREGFCGKLRDTYKRECLGDDWCHDFSMSTPVKRGNSGGAVYNHDGALAGLVTGVRSKAPVYGMGTALWDIRNEVFE